jgi:phospholipid/cholesterol/gamma-HCH transport system substrate-binding protein
MQKSRLAVVGAFVLAGIGLFAVGLFLIGDRRMLFSDNFEVYAEFKGISGLERGAVVRVSGMNAGEVVSVQVPGSPSGMFRVRLRVREDLHPLIRLDSVASIQTDGLVGNKFVQVETGTDGSPQVPEGGTIRSREPFDLAAMFVRLNETIDLITTAITDVKTGVDEALRAVSTTATEAQVLIGDIGTEMRTITSASKVVAADLQAILGDVRQGRGSLGKFVTDDEFYERARAIAAEAERAIANLREASESAKAAIGDFRNEGPVPGVVSELQMSLRAARETLTDLAASSEALKRNFFFRGFFNRRGFFDLDDITVQEYRKGALETNGRRPLRVWVNARVLFETGANGLERLTADGRARLDSAMAPFLGYPPDTPFVVEGYAGGVTSDMQFILSRSRAELVRDYVVSRFGLDAGYVTTMPMGAEAPESPANGQWEGVALTAFVATSRR